jgi:hypothetical protein
MEFNGTYITTPLLNVEGTSSQASINNRKVLEINEAIYDLCDSNKSHDKRGRDIEGFYQKFQAFVENFILSEKGQKYQNPQHHDEILLQMFRHVNRKQWHDQNSTAKRKHSSVHRNYALQNSVLLFLIISRYVTPSSELKDILR